MAMSLPRSTPAEQQVDPAAVLAFLDALEERPDIEMHSVMVVRHGSVVAEGWWAPYSADRPHLLYSLSKSFTSTAAAFAQAEGLFDLDDTVVSHFGEFEANCECGGGWSGTGWSGWFWSRCLACDSRSYWPVLAVSFC